MPFVRSGKLEETLHAKYPQLADMIRQEKQQLVDASISNCRPGNHGQINSSTTRASTSDIRNSEIHRRKMPEFNEVDSREGRAVSILNKEISNAETIFSMDGFPSSTSKIEDFYPYEPGTDGSGNALSKITSVTKAANYGKGRLIWPAANTQGFKLSDNDQRVSRRFLESSLGESPQSQPRGSPWGSILTENKGAFIKDIMAEGSTNPPMDTLSRNLVERRAQGSFTKRVSQKSRKKLQAEQNSQCHVSKEAQSPSGASKSEGNPWQGSTKAITIQRTDNIASQAASLARTPSNVARAISGSQLTMRQTIAHSNPASGETRGSPAHISEPSRGVSSPATPKRDNTTLQMTPPPVSTLSPSPQASRSLPKPQIQSIRHTPLPARMPSDSDANYAISDILSQQQAEKESIRDAAAKRSLQEIQTEQEFQEWWDQESKKVMEEQQATVAGPSGRPQRQKARGKGNRRYDKREGSVGEKGKTNNSKSGDGGSGSGSGSGSGRSKKSSNDNVVAAAAAATATNTNVDTAEGRKSEQNLPDASQRRYRKEFKK